MAKIRDYTSQVVGNARSNGPEASSESFGGGVGKSLIGLGRSIQGYADAQDKARVRAELSDLGNQIATKQDYYTQMQEKAVSSGEFNPDYSQKFMDSFDQDFEKMSEKVQTTEGREYFDRARNSMRLAFVKQTSAAQAQMMGAKAKNNYQQSLNKFSSSLVSNPAMFEESVSLHEDQITNLIATGLPAQAAEELKTKGRKELALSAAKGRIRLNPNEARNIINSGAYDSYLDGTDKYSLLEEADQEIRARDTEKEQAASKARRVTREKNRATQDNFFNKAIEGSLTIDEVMTSDLPAYGVGSKNQFLGIIKRQAAEGAEGSDPMIYRDMLDRIHSEEDEYGYIEDENDLAEYMGAGLSAKNVNELRRELNLRNQKPTEFKMKKKVLDEAKNALSRTVKEKGYIDDIGEKNFQEYAQFFSEEYERRIQKGETPSQILDPNSQNYIGNSIKNFQKRPQEEVGQRALEKKRKEQLRGLSQKDLEAVNWALKNKSNPENKDAAIKILKRNGLAD